MENTMLEEINQLDPESRKRAWIGIEEARENGGGIISW